MTDLLAFPFRMSTGGTMATHDDDSVAYYAEELSFLLSVSPGERPLVPDYGLEDSTFSKFAEDDLSAQCEKFGPPVKIQEVDFIQLSESSTRIVVSYLPLDETVSDVDYIAGV